MWGSIIQQSISIRSIHLLSKVFIAWTFRGKNRKRLHYHIRYIRNRKAEPMHSSTIPNKIPPWIQHHHFPNDNNKRPSESTRSRAIKKFDTSNTKFVKAARRDSLPHTGVELSPAYIIALRPRIEAASLFQRPVGAPLAALARLGSRSRG